MIQNSELLTVAMLNLVQKQIAVFRIRLCRNIVFNDCRIRDRDHVVKSQKAEASAVKLQYMLTGL